MSEVVRLGNEVVVFGIVQGQPCKRIMQNQLSKDFHRSEVFDIEKITKNSPKTFVVSTSSSVLTFY